MIYWMELKEGEPNKQRLNQIDRKCFRIEDTKKQQKTSSHKIKKKKSHPYLVLFHE